MKIFSKEIPCCINCPDFQPNSSFRMFESVYCKAMGKTIVPPSDEEFIKILASNGGFMPDCPLPDSDKE